MNKVLEKNFKKHCKIALLSYLSKIDCKNAKNQQILGFVFPRRKKAILKLLLRELKTKAIDVRLADMKYPSIVVIWSYIHLDNR